MSKALSRNTRSSEFGSRRAARRSDQNLGDWLDDAIRDDADDRFEDDEADDRLDAATRRLARASESRDESRPPRRWRDDARDQAARDQATRSRTARDEADHRGRRSRHRDAFSPADDYDRDDRGARGSREPAFDPKAIVDDAAALFERRIAESERHTAHALNNLANLIKRNQRPRNDGEGESVKRAIEAFAQHTEKSERKTARALNDIAGILETGQRERVEAENGIVTLAERLARIETRLSEQPGAGATVRPIRNALARLESRLDRLSTEDRTAEFENALSGLDQRLVEIAQRLDDDARQREAREAEERANRERETSARARAEAAPHISLNTVSGAAASPAARRPLVDAIAEITQRQRALEESVPDAKAQPAPVLAPPPAPMSDSSERFDSLQETIDAIARQLDGVREAAGDRADQQLVAMRQIEGLRREVQDVAHTVGQLAPRASISAVEDALRDLSFRVEAQRDRGVAEQLLAPAERIAGELRAVIRELDPSPIVRNLHEDVLTIGRRLDAMQVEFQQADGGDGAALRTLAQHTHDIKQQLAALTSRPLPLEKIETRLFDLTQRVDSLSLGAGGSAADMVDVVKSIRSIVANETTRGFETFSHRLEKIAGKFDEAVARIGAKRFDELGAKVDELGKTLSQRIDRSVAKPIDADQLAGKINDAVVRSGSKKFDELGARIEEIGKTLAQRIDRSAPKAADTSSLEQLVAKLAKKIDHALDGNSHTEGFEEIGRKIDRLETRIGAATPAESFARIEALLARPALDKHFAELAQRIDLVHKALASRVEHGAAPSEPSDVRFIEELVRGLDQKIDAALHSEGRQPDLQGIERQLSQLTYKIDRLEDPAVNPALGAAALARPVHNPQLDEIAERLERMQSALADRVNESARVEARHSDLANLVENLATRVNQALDPRADGAAFKSLETQIGALTKRLDGAGSNPALLAIESRIGELVARIEDTRVATSQATEDAVRRATQEILREAAAVAPGALGALGGEVEREISDIRKSQEESGQRTHETLLAVHETLERVVDRLAVFEDELSEIRTTPTPAAAYAAPAAAARPAPASSAAARPAPVAPPRRDIEAPAVSPSSRNLRLDVADDDDLMDFLLPPGGAATPRRDAGADRPMSREAEKPSVQSDFIAAARRAAQQAAADADAAEQAQQSRRGAKSLGGKAAASAKAAINGAAKAARATSIDDEEMAGGLSRVGSAIQQRKRPLLIGLAALVMLVGSYEIARFAIQGGAGTEHTALEQNDDAAPVDSAPAAKAPADKDAPPPAAEAVEPAPAPTPSVKETAPSPTAKEPTIAPLPRMIPPPKAPKAEAAPTDPTVTGSIGAAPLVAGDAIGPIKTLAAKGEPAAQFEYAARLVEGRGVTRDPKAAAQWFEKAAEQGLAPAQYRLGSMYEKGLGVERSYGSARKWYQLAADAGNARSMHNLAVLLAEGGDGKPDYGAASQWFQKAAEFGVRDSQYNLGILYARGLGVTQNLQQSYLWFSSAADQGDEDARKKRDEVGARLDSKELAAAKALASGFKAKAPLREANDILPPPGGWESVKDGGQPTAKPAGKAKVSQI